MASILVVDDDVSVHAFVTTALKAAGYSVSSETSGEAALTRLQRDDFDVVLLDQKLPGISGVQVLAAIRRQAIDVGIVCFTGCGSIRNAVDCLQNGAFDYVEKPVTTTELIVSIERAVEAIQLRRRQRRRVSFLEQGYGSPKLSIGDGPIERDVTSPAHFLNLMAEFGKAYRPTSAGHGTPEDWRQQLTDATVAALLGNTAGPVFWALARNLRLFTSSTSVDPVKMAEDARKLVRGALELVMSARPKTRTIVNHLEVRLATSGDLTARQLSAELHVNSSYVSRLLKLDTGLSFRQWRWAILLRSACRHLATSSEHVRQIAFSLGYHHPPQFNRDFRRVFANSPLRFRLLAARVNSSTSRQGIAGLRDK